MFDTWILSATNRLVWKCISHFVDKRTLKGRMIRSRRVKRRMPRAKLRDAICHALAIFEHFDPETEALFLGSSHTVYGIAPEVFQSVRAWNAGYNSGDFKIAYYTYQAVRQQWPKRPGQAVVISDDFWMVSHQIEFTPEFYQAVLVSHFTGMPYESDFLIGVHHRYVGRKIVRYRGKGLSEQILNARGFIAGLVATAKENRPGVTEARVKGHCKRAHFQPEGLKYLKALMDLVSEDGREIVFLRFPVREDYLAALDALQDDVWAPGDSLRAGKPLLDCFRMPFPQTYWADADHFTEEGARAFSAWLEPKLQALLQTFRQQGCK